MKIDNSIHIISTAFSKGVGSYDPTSRVYLLYFARACGPGSKMSIMDHGDALIHYIIPEFFYSSLHEPGPS